MIVPTFGLNRLDDNCRNIMLILFDRSMDFFDRLLFGISGDVSTVGGHAGQFLRGSTRGGADVFAHTGERFSGPCTIFLDVEPTQRTSGCEKPAGCT